MHVKRTDVSRFPLTWLLLALVALDIVCRANPTYGGFLPWIDVAAALVFLGVLRNAPRPAPERVSHT